MDKDFLGNIEKIDQTLSEHSLGVPNLEEICKIINTIKGPIEAILPIIALIPVYGKTIANALKLLLQLADSVCPK